MCDVRSRAAARQAAGEEWAPHAENGLGDDETPGSQPSGRSLRQRAKLMPASPERGEKMLVECDPVRDGPYRRHEAQGRTWADDCPGPAILPAPAADQRLGARIKGPTVLSQPPPAAHTTDTRFQQKPPKTAQKRQKTPHFYRRRAAESGPQRPPAKARTQPDQGGGWFPVVNPARGCP